MIMLSHHLMWYVPVEETVLSLWGPVGESRGEGD